MIPKAMRFACLAGLGILSSEPTSLAIAQSVGECGTFCATGLSKTDGQRPSLSGSPQTISDSALVVHYTLQGSDATTESWAESVLVFTEYALNRFQSLGWGPLPPDDEEDQRYDIYIYNTLAGDYPAWGITMSPGDPVPSPWEYPHGSYSWIGIYKDSIARPFPKYYQLSRVVAHELHHAIQFGKRWPATARPDQFGWFAENTSVFMESQVYPGHSTFYFRFTTGSDPLHQPQLAIVTFDQSYEYGGGLWPMFLDKRYGLGTVREIWESLAYLTPPQAIIAIDTALKSSGNPKDRQGVPSAMGQYANWRFFTGPRADTLHFFDASRLPAATIHGSYQSYPAAGDMNKGASQPYSVGGANYILFSGRSGTFDLTFDGADQYPWKAQLVLYHPGNAPSTTEIALDAYRYGSASLSCSLGDTVVLVSTATDKGTVYGSLEYLYSTRLFTHPVQTRFAVEWNGASHLGYYLHLDSLDRIESRESRLLETGSSHQVSVEEERFTADGELKKHQRWNSVPTDFKLQRSFTVLGFPEMAQYDSLKPATISGITIEDALCDSIRFRDPWFLESDGSQPDKLLSFRAPYSPTGARGESAGGVFLDQPVGSGGPSYSVGAWATRMINGATSYFLNWTGTEVTFQNASDTATGVVFDSSGANAIALYKGHLRGTTGAFTANNQRKVALTIGGTFCIVYTSANRIWYTNHQGVREYEVSAGASGEVNSYPSICACGNVVNIVWQSFNAYFGTCDIHLRRYDVATDSWGPIETVASFGSVQQGFIASPVISATGLTADGSQDLKMVAWREPDGIRIRRFGNTTGGYQWGSIWTVGGTSADCYSPSIEMVQDFCALVWEDRNAGVIRYLEATESASGEWSSWATAVVSPVGWFANSNPCLGNTYWGEGGPTWRPTVVWESYNNIVEGGRSVHVRQKTDYSTWSPEITSFSMASDETLGPVVGTLASNSAYSIVWRYNNQIYRTSWSGSWGSVSTIMSNANEPNVNIKGTTMLQYLWRYTDARLGGVRSGLGPAKQSVEGAPEFNATDSLSKRVTYRLNRHAIADLSSVLDGKDGYEGMVAFEVAGFKLEGAQGEAPLSLAMTGMQSVRFVASVERPTLVVAGAIYGAGLQVPVKIPTSGVEPLARVLIRDAGSGSILRELWNVPFSSLSAVANNCFGEYREVRADLSGLTGKEIYIEAEVIGMASGEEPIVVTDYLILRDPTDPLARKAPELEGGEIPTAYFLHQNYPNPFNPSTTIGFDIPEPGHVRLAIYNVLGELVKIPVDERLPAGSHRRVVSFTDLPSGVYLYRITAGRFSGSKKLVVLK